jgi:hypothetical protein
MLPGGRDECGLETQASMILQFINELRGDLNVTFEEGIWAAWLYDLLKPHVTEVVVCNPRKIALLQEGSKSDRIDARKLAEQLYMNKLQPVLSNARSLASLSATSRTSFTFPLYWKCFVRVACNSGLKQFCTRYASENPA